MGILSSTTRKIKRPKMTLIFNAVLSIKPISVEAERTFSTCTSGNCATKIRSRLANDTLSALVVLKRHQIIRIIQISRFPGISREIECRDSRFPGKGLTGNRETLLPTLIFKTMLPETNNYFFRPNTRTVLNKSHVLIS